MTGRIWETYKAVIGLPIFVILWIIFGFIVLAPLSMLEVPVVEDYYGVILLAVIVVPLVALALYMERRQKQK